MAPVSHRIELNQAQIVLSALASLQLHLDAAGKSPRYWIGCITSAKMAVQNALVAALAGTSAFEVADRRSYQEYRAAIERGEKLVPDIRLADFPVLIDRAKKQSAHLSDGKVPLLSAAEAKILKCFNRSLRNEAEHYKPGTWIIGAAGLLPIIADIVLITSRLMTGWAVRDATDDERAELGDRVQAIHATIAALQANLA